MLDFLKGAKTFVGGLILIGGGAAGMAFGVIDPITGVTLVGNGFAVWGIGGKIEEIAKSFEKQKEIHFDIPKIPE